MLVGVGAIGFFVYVKAKTLQPLGTTTTTTNGTSNDGLWSDLTNQLTGFLDGSGNNGDNTNSGIYPGDGDQTVNYDGANNGDGTIGSGYNNDYYNDPDYSGSYDMSGIGDYN